MDNISIAKKKVKELTIEVEKSLYELRYCDSKCNALTEELYAQLRAICDNKSCENKGLQFPLIRKDGGIYLNSNNEDLFKVLHILATDYNIILDYKQIC